MSIRWAITLVLASLAILGIDQASAQEPLDACERRYEAERRRSEALIDDLKRAVASDANCKAIFNGVIRENGKHKNDLKRGEALKISVEMKHDHERFVLGAPFSLRIHVVNQSATEEFYFKYSDVQVHVPKALIVGPDPVKTWGAKLAEATNDLERAKVAQERLAACFPMNQKSDDLVAVPPYGSHTVVWECGPVGYSPLNPLSWPQKIAFRPDEYTFSVNIPFTESREAGAQAFSPKSQEIAIETGLDSVFIALCAAIGAVFATLVRFQFRRIDLRSNSERYTKQELRFFQGKNKHDLIAFLVIGIIVTPLFISAANATQKFDQFISIQIFDAFGAVLSGFLFHTIVIRFGEPAIDWFFKRMFGVAERDIINWH